VDLYWAAFSAALTAAGGNSINDAYDVSIDRINRPERPIPSGRIGNVIASIWGCTLMIFGIVIGFTTRMELGLIALLAAILLWGYSAWWKRMPLAGNFVVAICGGLAFIYGAMAVSNPLGGLIPGLFAMMIHLGREIIKDVEDVAGDHLAGAITLPVVVGSTTAQRMAAITLLFLIALTPLPYKLELLGIYYLWLVMVFVDLPLIVISAFLIRGLEQQGLSRASFALKIVMISGLIALYAG